MDTVSISVEVNYNIPESELREDLKLWGHIFIPYAQPPRNESVGSGQHKVSFMIWWEDEAQTFDRVKSFIEGTGCRHTTQVEMRSLALALLGGHRHSGTIGPDYSSPFLCFGTVWTLPSERVSAVPLLMIPSFTLNAGNVEWDLPMAEGVFPSKWNYVGVDKAG
ncbi:MAG: hypothetical protein EXS59_01290 [Candidatus Taylorbacteria bacterium]|nr:hypothetical protein [Candidatus Taylorbacteria bacterium]